jgi:hypothetical protein
VKYQQPYGVSDPDSPYVNGDPSIGRAGSIPPAAAFEQPMRELVALLSRVGLTPSDADLKQILRAARSGRFEYYEDVGTTNNVIINPDPTYTALTVGDGVVIHQAVTNTGATNLTVNGITFPVKTNEEISRTLVGGELPIGSVNFFRFDGAAWRVINRPGSKFLERNLTLYVRLDGSDANDGSANDSQHAFQTLQAAMNKSFSYAPGPYVVTLQIGQSGTYQGVRTPVYPGPVTTIKGDVVNRANTVISGTGGNLEAVEVYGVNFINVEDVTVQAQQDAIYNIGPNQINLTRVAFGPCGRGCIFTDPSATCVINTGCNIVANSVTFAAVNGGFLHMKFVTFTITNAVTFTTFMIVQSGGIVASWGCTFVNAGNFTGQKHNIAYNSINGSLGEAITYYPGTVAGSPAAINTESATHGWFIS